MNINRLLKLSGLMLFLLFIAISAAQRGPSNPALLLDVQRDYTGNIRATDRMWFYKDANGNNLPNGGGQYPLIEVPENNNLGITSTKAVYVRGDDVVVKVKLKTYLGAPDAVVGTLTVDQAKYVSNGTENSISVSGPGTVSVPGSGGSQEITLTFSGLPNFVSKGQLKFRYFVTLTQASGTNPTGYIAWGQTSSAALWPDTLYITDQTPTGLQTVPWTDLLGFSCSWAQGQTGMTNVRNQLAYGIYWGNWVYSANSPHYTTYVNGSFQNQRFNLKDCLEEISNENMDCQDFSNLFSLSAMGQGHSPAIKRVIIPGGDPAFKTNKTCPSSLIPTIPSMYSQYVFNFHQIAFLSGVVDTTSAHWTDSNGSLYQYPPVGWDLLSFWQVPQLNYFLEYRGLVFGPPNATTPTVAPDPTEVPITLHSIE